MILIKTSGKQFPLDDNPIEIDLTGCNKDKLELYNNISDVGIVFEISDKNISDSISMYLNKIDKENDGMDFKLLALSDKKKFIVFNGGYKVLLSSLAFYEIGNRMVLLNEKPEIVNVNVLDEI